MNNETDEHKVGLIGEYLVKIKLNTYGVNTGNVDKDTGTDIVLFNGQRILTAQVKSGSSEWNNGAVHGVHLHFKVLLKWDGLDDLLDPAQILWKRVDIPDREFKPLTRDSIAEIFEQARSVRTASISLDASAASLRVESSVGSAHIEDGREFMNG